MIAGFLLLVTVILLGVVQDTHNQPLPLALVSLSQGGAVRASTKTDQRGHYKFPAIEPGVYTVRAELAGFKPSDSTSVDLRTGGDKTLDITLEAAFFDEPTYTVAGVKDNTYRGGHGADTVLRSSEGLAKETAALRKSPPGGAQPEQDLRNEVAANPQSYDANYQLGSLLVSQAKCKEAMPYVQHAASLGEADAKSHHLLGDAFECLGNSLAAVHAYQRSADLQSSELYLFDLGTELLIHLAPDAAGVTFSKGVSLFPKSTRLLLGLAVSLYSRGFYEEAARRFFEACDINPANAEPYLFLGKVQRSEITHEEGYISRLRRFSQLQPDNKWSGYYYAVALWKQRSSDNIADDVCALLNRSITIDPSFALAYLQLGIVQTDQDKVTEAVAAFQRAIALDASLDEPHYRLAQIFKRQGKTQLSQKELQIYSQLSKQHAIETERGRSEIQRFVITLREQPR